MWKMKKIKLLFLILFMSFFLYSENFSLVGNYTPELYSTIEEFLIGKDNVEYVFRKTKEKVKVGYKFQKIDNQLFIKMEKSFPLKIHQNYQTIDFTPDDKLLILAGNELDFEYLRGNEVKKKNRVLLFATTAGFDDKWPFIYEMFSFTERIVRKYEDCSSYLIERTKEYPINNLNSFAVDTPWIEGVKGDGIGEGFTIKNDKIYPYLLIMNGYISYKKPYLYKQNNRIKKIKVTGVKSVKTAILDVLDTPHPQTVDISFLNEPEDIRIEIADVYKGTKYDDTCLNFCITYTNKVIPYENSIGD